MGFYAPEEAPFEEAAPAPEKKTGVQIFAECAQAINQGLAEGSFTPDEELLAEQATTLLQKGKMSRQDLQDKALGVTPQAKYMRQQQG